MGNSSFKKLVFESKMNSISKRLSYILRHNPKRFKINLDKEGWADIDDVLNGLHYFKDLIDLEKEDLFYLVYGQKKKRFEIYENRIKANYGHTISIKKTDPAIPPDILYHGTAKIYLESILREGLLRMRRQYVHLSVDLDTAIETGKRRDKTPAVIQINSKKAYQDGVVFYKGSDKVWLSDNLLPKYLKLVK
jgi:putative RNA 2'-phosphotransferase